MIYIVPSRGRPHVMTDLITSWAETRTMAKLCIAVDESDPTLKGYHTVLRHAPDWVQWIRVNTEGMTNALNYCALRYSDRWNDAAGIIGFMGDDHRPRTHGWDAHIELAVQYGSYFVYANDLLQGVNLPTQVAIDARVIRALGHMAPGELTHLYLDNYWKMLGERTQRLRYLDDVVIEHMHPVAGKAEWDDGYKRVNGDGVYEHDRLAFESYVNEERMLRDCTKVMAI